MTDDKKYILFDFDGTLADSFDCMLELLKEISGKYHLVLPSEKELKNQPLRDLFKQSSLSFIRRLMLIREMKKLATKSMAGIKPFNGMKEVLIHLKKQGFQLYILTSNTSKNVQLFLEANQLDNTFDGIIDQASLFGKHRTIRKFLKKQKIFKEQVIYVGDEVRDLQSMKKAGVQMIAVSWGFNSKSLLERYTNQIADHPEQLCELLEKEQIIFKNLPLHS